MLKDTLTSGLCRFVDLGLIGYPAALEIQKETLKSVIAGGKDTLILCEHPPVFTLGSVATEGNFLFSKDGIINEGASIIRIDRGGEVTFHGPGQLVVYPIFHLGHFGRDLKFFMNKLEEVAIDLLRGFDIVANRKSGQRGVWVNDKKIASIGIGVRKWVSYHGMAVNLNTDLRFFGMIKPCGLDVRMTSAAQILGKDVSMDRVKAEALRSFSKIFSINYEG